MASSLSNFVNNILKELIKLNVNMDTIMKDVKLYELNISIGTILECTCFKYDLTEYKCLCCKKVINKIDEMLNIFK